MTRKYGYASVSVFNTRQQMGECSANDVEACIKKLLKEKNEVNCIFAAAPSQNDFLNALLEKDIPWDKINAFHMDEYVGLPENSDKTFRHFLAHSIFDKKPFRTINYINGNSENPEQECERYSNLLKNHPIDIVFFGIGDNGHIAFNDPPVANFSDEKQIKIVTLDHSCRTQQVNDGCFISLDDVPTQALTLTIPTLMSGHYLFGIVPGLRKAEATKNALEEPISQRCPASIVRTHPNCKMYLDLDSSSKLTADVDS